MKKKKDFNLNFPIVKNVSPRTLAQDIVPYSPGDENNMRMWRAHFKEMGEKLKKDLDERGIPMPTIVYDTTPGPITYGIKTVDENGNTLHSQL